MFQPLLHKVIDKQDLTRTEAMAAMELIMEGQVPSAQLASFLTALRMKGETVEEITGMAVTMRSKALRVAVPTTNLLDTCGTGGDGGNTFNISTASAIVTAAGGARVAKHGNRAVSSRSGSADALEALGVNIELTEIQAKACLDKTNLCFMFAPFFHGAMKHAVPTRREMGFRTVFNLLGPLTNPAGADRQLIGVFDYQVAEKMARVLRELGVVRCLIVAGEDGLDEISIAAPTRIVELKDENIRTYTITPEEIGLVRYACDAVTGGDAAYNATVIRHIFEGNKGANRDIVLANTAAALYLSEKCESIREGVQLAAHTIDSGLAMSKLEQLISVTGGFSRVN